MASPKPATDTIVKRQQRVRDTLPFDDTQDFRDAQKGLLGRRVPNTVSDANGKIIWDNDSYGVLKDQGGPPDTVSPSLWRQLNLTVVGGLFEVTKSLTEVGKGIYQVRGLDLSNTTIIEECEGIIVIDPLTSAETGAAAFDLYKEVRTKGKPVPVKAIIYTHTHVDHYGGVKGFVSEEEVASGAVKIFAPEGFLEHAVSEGVYTGTVMGRRAAYMYGAALPRGPQAQIGAGLGQRTPTGTVMLIAPTDEITTTGEEKAVDGVKMVFQMALNTEAPDELLIFFPSFGALCAAEDATHTFHNLLTLRGALVHDPHSWALYLTETIDLFGGETQVIFTSHHWPVWGSERVLEFLTCQRDPYAYVHDQTLRMMKNGFNGAEIAERMVLPPAISKAWNARGYYGSVNHNVKAIYQRYTGWFDANPAHLWEHIPTERAKRYVDLAGGITNIISKGFAAFDAGDFRWSAELLNHAVFADPSNEDARSIIADTYEQLRYGAENGTWRNFFISGTTELRYGNFGTPTTVASADVIAHLTPEMVFDTLGIQINGPKAWDKKIDMEIVLTDRDAKEKGYNYRCFLSNGALIYITATRSGEPNVTLHATTKTLPALAIYALDPDALEDAGIQINGDKAVLVGLAGLLDPGDPDFNIVTP